MWIYELFIDLYALLVDDGVLGIWSEYSIWVIRCLRIQWKHIWEDWIKFQSPRNKRVLPYWSSGSLGVPNHELYYSMRCTKSNGSCWAGREVSVYLTLSCLKSLFHLPIEPTMTTNLIWWHSLEFVISKRIGIREHIPTIGTLQESILSAQCISES